MSWRNELTVGILRAERIFFGTTNGGLGSELSVTELAYLDGITAGTALASKALVLGASKEIAQITTLGATAINLGLAAGELGVLTLYPATTASGDFVLKCQDNSGDDTYTLQTPLATSAAVNMTLPNVTGYLAASTAQLTLAEMDVLGAVVQGVGQASKALVLNGSSTLASGIQDFNANFFKAGVADTTRGQIAVYGAATGSTDGGLIYLHAAVDHDDVNDYYTMGVYEDDWVLELANATDIMKYNYGATQFEMIAASYFNGEAEFGSGIGGTLDINDGSLTVGASAVAGTVTCRGGATGSAQGGQIILHTADDHDTTISQFLIQATSETLTIGSILIPGAITITPSIINIFESIYTDQPVDFAGTFSLGGVQVSASPAELNYLDITALGTGEASKAVVLDASGDFIFPSVSTIDFATNNATLNLGQDSWMIDGTSVETTGAELNFLASATAGTQVASKAVIADANINIGTTKVTALHIGTTGSEVAVDATAAELNLNDNQVASVTFTPSGGAGVGTVECTFFDAGGVQMATASSFKFWFSSIASGVSFLPITTSVSAGKGAVDKEGAAAGADLFHGVTNTAGEFDVTVTAAADDYYMVIQLPNGKLQIAAVLTLS